MFLLFKPQFCVLFLSLRFLSFFFIFLLLAENHTKTYPHILFKLNQLVGRKWSAIMNYYSVWFDVECDLRWIHSNHIRQLFTEHGESFRDTTEFFNRKIIRFRWFSVCRSHDGKLIYSTTSKVNSMFARSQQINRISVMLVKINQFLKAPFSCWRQLKFINTESTIWFTISHSERKFHRNSFGIYGFNVINQCFYLTIECQWVFVCKVIFRGTHNFTMKKKKKTSE